MIRILSLHILFAACAACLVCGCSSEEYSDAQEASVPLVVSVSTGGAVPASRSIVNTTGTATGEADHIGVFLTAADGYSPYADEKISSAIFKLSRTGSSTDTWTASRPVNLQSRTARLYAWYPVSGNNENGLKTETAGSTRTVPIEVSASQSFDGTSTTDCSQTDYMYGAANGTAGNADAIKVSSTANNPTIYLQHALAQVVFTIEYKASRLPDDQYDFVKSITLSGGSFLAGTGTMQLNDGILASLSSATTLTFAANTNTSQLPGSTGSPAAVAYGLVAPNSGHTGNVTLSMVLGGKGNTTYDRTLTATTSTWFAQAWEKGKRYTYHLMLDKNDLTFKSVDIAGWDDKSQGNTDMPPLLGKKLVVFAEIEGEKQAAPATRVDPGTLPASNTYDRIAFLPNDKINVICTRNNTPLASAGYTLDNTENWVVESGSTGLGFLPATTCRAEFPVTYTEIAQNQSTEAAFLRSNLLITPEVPVSTAEIHFTDNNAFKHKHARLTLNFTAKSQSLPAFSRMEVKGRGLRTAGSEEESIILLQPEPTVYTWCAVISPRSGESKIDISITDAYNVTYQARLTLATVAENNNYIYTLTLQNDVLVPVGSEIKPWTVIERHTGGFDN
ncbi:fimbrillin family protein [Bacteroides sp. GD17]|jgi:hypothetical protein|uniref:fimbrillin family protein n=1 Tax=Bacteroides sp. GD17 TaxID=3139826 RepID=UPI0025DFCC4B|nr:fimbrillin family protein [uncultured Bacteroides sp.]